jgi:dTDP-D-glucose 4,6-dehydratase
MHLLNDLRYAIDATKIKTEPSWTPRQDHASRFHQTVA